MAERKRGRAGQRDRRRRLARTHGLCEMCLALGRTTIATRVDHIVPLAKDGDDVDSNTRNLCVPHHTEVTAEQFGFDVAKGQRGVDCDGRPTDPDHPWNGQASGQPPPGGQNWQAGRRRTPTPPSVRCESNFQVKSSGHPRRG